jgi:hypothetical protein
MKICIALQQAYQLSEFMPSDRIAFSFFMGHNYLSNAPLDQLFLKAPCLSLLQWPRLRATRWQSERLVRQEVRRKEQNHVKVNIVQNLS